MVHTSTKDYVKFDRHDVKPMQIFPPGSGGTGNFHLVNAIYNAISKT